VGVLPQLRKKKIPLESLATAEDTSPQTLMPQLLFYSSLKLILQYFRDLGNLFYNVFKILVKASE